MVIDLNNYYDNQGLIWRHYRFKKPIYAGGHLGDESDDLPKGYQK